MGFKMCIAVSFIVTLSSMAQADSQTAPTERWEGYRRVNSPEVRDLNLPFQQFAENNVFQMISVDLFSPSERYEVVDVQQVPEETNAALLADVENPRAFQIETCRNQGLRYCPVFSRAASSTAFTNRNTLHTCRHGFHNWISIASQLNGNISVDRISPPMVLRAVRNNRMTNLYNSATASNSSDLMKLSFINTNERLNYRVNFDDGASSALNDAVFRSDYVEMQLNMRISSTPALTERTGGLDSLRMNEETYLIGYPGRTNVFGGAGDAPGNTLMISNGFAQAPAPANAYLRTSNFGSGGMSGAALVTASGELVGMNCSGSESPEPSNAVAYAFPLGRPLMQQYWNYITYPNDSQLPVIEQFDPSIVER